MSQDPSPLAEIFNERGALLAFFGALGGAVRSAVLKTTWRESLRVIFVGCSTSFGVGTLSPFLIKPWVGDLPDGVHGALGTLCAAAFLTGLISTTLFERWLEAKEAKSDSEK
jgi:drug/metabolite transporter (DMT)-like permease